MFRIAEIHLNLAGSVSSDIDETQDNESSTSESGPLESRPDLRIRLVKPSGRAIVFNCTLPTQDAQTQLNSDDSDLPTYSVDSVEVESVPGYFVFTDLFDDEMYDHTMQLLIDRKLDAAFQHQLQNFCTAQEHDLYLKFLDEFSSYCKE